MNGPYERAEDDLCHQLDEGQIDLEEFNQEMRELGRCYREDAQEAAQEAYNRELDGW